MGPVGDMLEYFFCQDQDLNCVFLTLKDGSFLYRVC